MIDQRKLRLFALMSLVLVGALQGCATLPDHIGTASSAFPDPGSTPLGRLAKASVPDPALSGFRLEPIAEFAFQTRIELAARSVRSLDVQYYVLSADNTGKHLLIALRDAALRGVRVRLLLDDLYTSGEDELLSAFAAFPNIEVRLFNPFPSGRSSLASRFLTTLADFGRTDHRMHNKVFIADNALVVTGGRNIADEYFMRSNTNNFVDIDILAAGAVVEEYSHFFDLYWNSPYCYPIAAIVHSESAPESLRARFDRLVSDVKAIAPDTGVPERLRRYATTPNDLGADVLELTQAAAKVYADPVEKVLGANIADRKGTVRDEVAQEMLLAREEVFVVTPYFIPGPTGMRSMETLRSRGVRLRLLTNSLASTDEPLVHTGYARYRQSMLKTGVEIYELSPALARKRNRLGRFQNSLGRIHAKVAVIDYSRIFIGSMNLDDRSERRNTEIGVVIDSPGFAAEFLAMMDFDSSVYRLRLSANGRDIEWVDGEGRVFKDEPETSAWLRFEVNVLGPLVPESEL